MWRTVSVVVLGLLTALFSSSSASAQNRHVADPEWSLVAKAEKQSASATGRDAARLSAAACKGTVDTPYFTQEYDVKKKKWIDGVGYQSAQDCVGDFESQKVCVELWNLDYYGNEHRVSSKYCKSYFTDHAYAGRFLRCSEMGLGTVRFFAKGSGSVTSPSGKTYSTTPHTSGTRTLC